MYKLIIAAALFSITLTANAQQKALTENGREVILYENGTWQYTGDSSATTGNSSDSITTNPVKFAKTSKATFAVKSNTVNVGVYINPAIWSFTPHKQNEPIPEYAFYTKSADIYGMLITEKTQIGLENLREIALANAKKASDDVRVTNTEYRTVNNQKVLCLELKGTIKGIKFVYFGYYYSCEGGTVQLLTYTSQQLYASNKKAMEDFLNGFTIYDAK